MCLREERRDMRPGWPAMRSVGHTIVRIATASETPPFTAAAVNRGGTAFAVLAGASLSHLLNDTIQALLPALYPMFKATFALSFTQVGLMTLTLQLTASLLQPLVGLYTDRRPTPYALVVGMTFTLIGVLLLSAAGTFEALLVAAGLMGIGSSIFHPESSRIARMASGGRHGFAQSFFQVGGNLGSSFGPLLAAFLVVPRGQASVAWCAPLAVVAIVVLWRIGRWYQEERMALARHAARASRAAAQAAVMSPRRVGWALTILAALIFSKYFYLASLTSYYTFYLITRFHLSIRAAQIDLFIFLGAVAVGTMLGGLVGDRIGVKNVIWISILGVFPFTALLPYATLFWTPIVTVCIGLILASAFSAIVVYAQELMPGRTGTVAGLFFGFAFGMGGVGAAVLGKLADATSLTFVYQVCAYLPALGLLAALLPGGKTWRQ
jgi:MFS transporter, FSR family, fosmidomycin resistance protein